MELRCGAERARIRLGSSFHYLLSMLVGLFACSLVTAWAFKPSSTDAEELRGEWLHVPRSGDQVAYYFHVESGTTSIYPPTAVAGVKLWRSHLHPTAPPPPDRATYAPRVFTAEEVRADTSRLLLVIAGHVYDVSEGRQHYGEGGYNIFVGRDCSGAFVTGNFEPDACTPSPAQTAEEAAASYKTPSLSDLSGIRDWLSFYMKHETYTFEGVIAPGHYFSEGAHPTRALLDLFDGAAVSTAAAAAEKTVTTAFPTCNYRYMHGSDPEYWCEGYNKLSIIRWRIPAFEPAPRVRCGCVPHGDEQVDPTAEGDMYPMEWPLCGGKGEEPCTRSALGRKAGQGVVDVFTFKPEWLARRPAAEKSRDDSEL